MTEITAPYAAADGEFLRGNLHARTTGSDGDGHPARIECPGAGDGSVWTQRLRIERLAGW